MHSYAAALEDLPMFLNVGINKEVSLSYNIVDMWLGT